MNKNSKEFASNLSYEIVKEMAPEELDLFDDIKEEFFENPDDFMKKDSGKKDKILGFGGGVGEVFVAATILPIIWGILAQISKKGIESLTDEGSKAVIEWIKNKLEGKKGQPSKEKLKEIRDYVCQNAYSTGLDKDRARILADSFIGKLTLM